MTSVSSLARRVFFDLPQSPFDQCVDSEAEREISALKVDSPETLARALWCWANADFLGGSYFNLVEFIREHHGENAVQFLPEALRIGIQKEQIEVWSTSMEGFNQSKETPQYFLGKSDEELLLECQVASIRIMTLEPRSRIIIPLVVLYGLFICTFIEPISIYATIILAVLIFGAPAVVILTSLFSRKGRTRLALLLVQILDTIRFIFIALPIRIVLFLIRGMFGRARTSS